MWVFGGCIYFPRKPCNHGHMLYITINLWKDGAIAAHKNTGHWLLGLMIRIQIHALSLVSEKYMHQNLMCFVSLISFKKKNNNIYTIQKKHKALKSTIIHILFTLAPQLHTKGFRVFFVNDPKFHPPKGRPEVPSLKQQHESKVLENRWWWKKRSPKNQNCDTQSLSKKNKPKKWLFFCWRCSFLLIQFCGFVVHKYTCIFGGWCSCNLMCWSDRVFHLRARCHPANPPDNVDTIKLAKLIDIIFLNIVTWSVNILGLSENRLIICKKQRSHTKNQSSISRNSRFPTVGFSSVYSKVARIHLRGVEAIVP